LIKAQDALDEVSLSLIRKRKRERDAEEDKTDKEIKSDDVQRIPNDFLDLLYDARDKTTGQALTEEEIRDQANTFLLAGHETTGNVHSLQYCVLSQSLTQPPATPANTLAYTIFLVAQHPEVDDKLFEELSDLLGDESAALDLNQLSAMTHLNMALKESLRMYPPATSTAREADVDVTIGDNYSIPKGVPSRLLT
jgi:cytochrome P450